MEELLIQLSQDLQNLTIPKPYDWLILFVSGLSVVLSFVIFIRQTKISKKQTEIMEQQNKISLFEKRYKVYTSLKSVLEFKELLLNHAELTVDVIMCHFTMRVNYLGERGKIGYALFMLSIYQDIQQADLLFSMNNKVDKFYQTTAKEVCIDKHNNIDWLKENSEKLIREIEKFEKNIMPDIIKKLCF